MDVGIVRQMLAEFDSIPKQALKSLPMYMTTCMLTGGKHGFKEMSSFWGLAKSTFSRLMQRAGLKAQLDLTLNRANRRLIDKLRRQGSLRSREIYLIVDATFTGRSGKGVENAQYFSQGKKSVFGHKLTNILLVIGDKEIPLACLSHHTRDYCKTLGEEYLTEMDRVNNWLNALRHQKLLTNDEIKRMTVLMDSGYDSKRLLKTIRRLGAHYLVCLRSGRSLNGQRAAEYFKRRKSIAWKSIRIENGPGSKTKQSRYRIKTAADLRLKGVGLATVVCSEHKLGKRKYLATSNKQLTGKQICEMYKVRWKIESWHRHMKQNMGYGDCRAKRFNAVLCHILCTIIAFVLMLLVPEQAYKRGTTFAEIKAFQALETTLSNSGRFGYKDQLRTTVQEEKRRIIHG